MKIVTVLGTRPEIIKLSPLIPLLDKGFDHKIIHTGQHYNYEMDRIFFEELGLRDPDYILNVGSDTHGAQTAKMLVGTEKILIDYKPNLVNVLADPNTPLAGALAAAKLNIPVAHIEAGCRSFNRHIPEEINRILIDHCSELLFASDKTAVNNLLREGIPKEKIHLAGSTVIDACLRNSEIAEKSNILDRLSLEQNGYVVATIHRAENTDDLGTFRGIIDAVGEISEDVKVIFPVHPRTRKIMEQNNIFPAKSVVCTEPFGYLDFLKLAKNSKFIITDSGGIQEEADTLNVPCVITRNETEWTELVEAGKNILATTGKDKIVEIAKDLLNNEEKLEKTKKTSSIRNPGASKRIIDVVNKYVSGVM